MAEMSDDKLKTLVLNYSRNGGEDEEEWLRR
jgi:hypothetical protein